MWTWKWLHCETILASLIFFSEYLFQKGMFERCITQEFAAVNILFRVLTLIFKTHSSMIMEFYDCSITRQKSTILGDSSLRDIYMRDISLTLYMDYVKEQEAFCITALLSK